MTMSEPGMASIARDEAWSVWFTAAKMGLSIVCFCVLLVEEVVGVKVEKRERRKCRKVQEVG